MVVVGPLLTRSCCFKIKSCLRIAAWLSYFPLNDTMVSQPYRPFYSPRKRPYYQFACILPRKQKYSSKKKEVAQQDKVKKQKEDSDTGN
jgi:hypothetical protein